jgi:hypothetical protein
MCRRVSQDLHMIQVCFKMSTGNSPSEVTTSDPSLWGQNPPHPRPHETSRRELLPHPRPRWGIKSPQGSLPHSTEPWWVVAGDRARGCSTPPLPSSAAPDPHLHSPRVPASLVPRSSTSLQCGVGDRARGCDPRT